VATNMPHLLPSRNRQQATKFLMRLICSLILEFMIIYACLNHLYSMSHLVLLRLTFKAKLPKALSQLFHTRHYQVLKLSYSLLCQSFSNWTEFQMLLPYNADLTCRLFPRPIPPNCASPPSMQHLRRRRPNLLH
jgi:hypothetical protein